MVFVVSKNGQPLMPTENHRMVRLLLKAGKATVLKQTPFTIKLKGNVHNFVQPVTLGVDTGSGKIRLSATTKKKELYTAEVELRDDVTGNLSSRREFRRARRNRNTRYRAPRFNV